MITTSSILITFLLIGLLVLRGLLNGPSNPTAARARFVLNIALVPLTLMFLASVVAVITSGTARAPTNTVSAPTAASGGGTTPGIAVTSATAPPAPTAGATPMPVVPSSQPDTERLLVDDFARSSSGWIERHEPDWSAAYLNGQYQLDLTGRATVDISTPLPADNYRLSADVTLAQGDAGLVFLSIEPATFYRLLLRDDGTYTLQSVDQAHQNAVTTIIAWTANAAIKADGTANRLRIDRQNNNVRFYVNDQPLNAFTVPAGAYQNQYGFALAADKGQGRAAFDNLLIERFSQP